MCEYSGEARLSGEIITGRWLLACGLLDSCATLRSGEGGKIALRLVSLWKSVAMYLEGEDVTCASEIQGIVANACDLAVGAQTTLLLKKL